MDEASPLMRDARCDSTACLPAGRAGRLRAKPLGPNAFRENVIVGPDTESRPWVTRLAQTLGVPHLVFSKHRPGDQEVEFEVPAGVAVADRRLVIVDDICSTGATLIGAVRRLREAGARRLEVVVAHALFKPSVDAALRRLGVDAVISADSCLHPSNRIHLAGLLADALTQELTA